MSAKEVMERAEGWLSLYDRSSCNAETRSVIRALLSELRAAEEEKESMTDHAIKLVQDNRQAIAEAVRSTAEGCKEAVRAAGVTIFHIDGQIVMQKKAIAAIDAKYLGEGK
jgi:hypothetical protein